MARSRGHWVKWLGQKTHVQEIVGLNPAIYCSDVSDPSYYIVIDKKNNKGSQMEHTIKNCIFRNTKYKKISLLTLLIKK